MKKFVSILLAIIIALSVVAFAATYECGECHAVFATAELLAAHKNSTCLEQYKDCLYCGAKVAKDNLAGHEADCPKGVDWEGLLGKVTDALGSIDLVGIVEKIKPAFEKVIGFAKDNLGNIELPVAAE